MRRYIADPARDPRELFKEENRTSFTSAASALTSDLDFNAAEGRKAGDLGTAAYANAELMVFGFIATAILMCLLLAYGITSNVSVPLRLLTNAMIRLAGNDWSTDVPGIDRGDELGEMARTVNVFKTNSMQAATLAGEQHAEQAAKEQRATRFDALTLAFEAKASELAGMVAARPASCRAPRSP